MNLKFLDNPMIKNFALKSLKKSVIESGTKAIVITLDDKGEFIYTFFKDPVKVMTETDYNKLLNLATQ